MDDKHLLTPRSDLRMRHYESVVEQDHRLQMIRYPFDEDFEKIVILDKRVANGNKTIKSHPMAIYLNKSAHCSKQLNKTNTNLIYAQGASFPIPKEIDKLSLCTDDAKRFLMLLKQDNCIRTMGGMEIKPRKRWNKLYDRNPSFKTSQELLSVEISKKITHIRNVKPVEGPDKYRNVEYQLRKYKMVSESLIYRRCQLKSKHKEPGSSNVIDEVSGENLCHITLLCRDIICECNKCTTGCTGLEFICDACKMILLSETFISKPNIKISGSYAEKCMLPIFYVPSDRNNSVKKMSDVDMMVDTRNKVGFDVKEYNLDSIVDTRKSRPGYLQLRGLGTDDLCVGWAGESLDETLGPTIKNKLFPSHEPHHSRLNFSQHGPATEITSEFTRKMCVTEVVFYSSCSSWPPIAKSWIDRKRPF